MGDGSGYLLRLFWPLWLCSILIAGHGILLGTLESSELGNRVDQIKKEAPIVFEAQYDLACSQKVFEQALAHPMLMGALWKAYGYAPKYQVSGTTEQILVVDPTGFEGNLQEVLREDAKWIYLGTGKVTHWAVPALRGGEAVFEVESQKSQTAKITVQVFLKPESNTIGAVLKMLKWVIMPRIDNRITLNLQDFERILVAIEKEPNAVRSTLPTNWHTPLDRAFGNEADSGGHR